MMPNLKSFFLYLIICGCVSLNADFVFSEECFTSWTNHYYQRDNRSGSFNLFGASSASIPPEECSTYEELKSVLEEKLNNRETQFSVHLEYDFLFSETHDILKQAIDAIVYDDDYLLFNLLCYSYQWSGYDGDITINYEIEYLTTYNQENFVSELVDEILSEIITDDMDDEEKVKAIHDWILVSVKYDTTYEEHSAFAALFFGTAVCQGYALLAYKMLSTAGIESVIVGSVAMNHAWNMLNLCGNWYHMDVTWDDPVPDVLGRILYNYFNLSDDEIKQDHTWEEDNYPEAPFSYEEGVCSENLLVKTYFPHIASNGVWETEIALINTSSEQNLSGFLKAYNNDGEEISESRKIELGPMERLQITVGSDFSDADKIGYIVLESYTVSPAGYTKFYIEGKYRVAVPAVTDINTGTILISHIASNSNWWTGISLLNTEEVTKNILIEFDNGVSKSLTLPGYTHSVFTIKSLFNGQSRGDIHSAVIRNGEGIIGLELFSGGNLLSGILLKDSTESCIYYPHIASNTNWYTGIVAYNCSESACNLTITPFKADGISFAPRYCSIDAMSQYVGTAAGLGLPSETAWLQIEGTSPLAGFELFGTKNGRQLAGYSGIGISRKKGVFPKYMNSGWTGIAFVNIEKDRAAILLTAYDDSGSVLSTETLQLDGYSKVVGLPQNIFSGNIIGATYLKFSSDKELAAFQLNGSPENMMLDGLPGM